MIITVTEHDFIKAFDDFRTYANCFSYEGKKALFQFIEDTEDERNPMELDIVALCGEFAEYDSLEEFQSDYGDEYKSINDIDERTMVIDIETDEFRKDGRFIIAAF
tara:strand:+ start:620 stop:937 length:318 start_codon:yes stop_codon:yes gene_type:complete